MADTNGSKTFEGLKVTWSNPKARKGILLSAGVVGAVILVTGLSMRGGNQTSKGVQNNASLAAPPVVRTDVTAAVSPQYKEMVEKRDQVRADNAAKTSLDMALPQVTGLSGVKDTQIKDTQNDQGAGSFLPAMPPSRNQANQTPSAQAAPQPSNAQVAMMAKQSELQTRAQLEQQIRTNPAYAVAGAFMTSAAQSINSARSTSLTIITAPSSNGRNGAADGTNNASQQAAAQAAAANAAAAAIPAKVLIGAGQALYATLDTAINSDYSGPVVATVRQGPFQGARLIGTKGLEYDAVVLKFTAVSLPTGGPAIPVQAYAINLGDVNKFGTTGLQGSTDYHVMQRYVLPAIVAFGQTYGYAASVTGTSTTTNGITTTESTTPLSSKDRALVALGGALAPIAADMQKQAARPITILMDANTEIGILFTQDVTDKTAQAAVASAAQGINVGLNNANPSSANVSAPAQQFGTYSGAPLRTDGGSSTYGAMKQTFTAPYSPGTAVYNGQNK